MKVMKENCEADLVQKCQHSKPEDVKDLEDWYSFSCKREEDIDKDTEKALKIARQEMHVTKTQK